MADRVNYYFDLSEPTHPKAAGQGASSATLSSESRGEWSATNSSSGLSDRIAGVAEQVFSVYGETIERLGDT